MLKLFIGAASLVYIIARISWELSQIPIRHLSLENHWDILAAMAVFCIIVLLGIEKPREW